MRLRVVYLLGGNGRRRAEGLEVKGFVVFACRLLNSAVPEAVGIVAVEGQQFAEGYGRPQLRPSRTGVEWQVEAHLLGYLLQRHQVLSPTPVFVVKLSGHHRPAVLPLQPLYLREDLPVQLLSIVHERGVLFPHLTALGKHPVGYAAVARLSVTEGAKSQDDGHLLLLAQFDKPPQIALTVPTEHAFLLLDVVPEYVGGYHRHATGLHLADFLQPLVGRQAAVVYLAHDGAHPASVNHQAMTVPGYGLAKVACPRLFLGIYLHIVGTGIRLVGQDVYIVEFHVAGMAQEEALGRQVAPHRGFRIFAFFLVLDGFGYRVQFFLRHTATMMDGDVREPDVLYRVAGQSGDGAPHRAGIANLYVAQTDAVDVAHRVDGYQPVKVVASLLTFYIFPLIS